MEVRLCECIGDELFRIGEADVGKRMREVRAFAEGVELVSFFELSVQGEEDEGAIADDRAVEVRSFMGNAGVRIVEGVRDAGVVVFWFQIRNNAGGADDILGYVFEGFAGCLFIGGSQCGFAVFEKALRAGAGQRDAEISAIGEDIASGGEFDLVLLGERVADAGPEIFSWCVCDDAGVDEGVVGRTIDVVDLTEGVVFVVVRADTGDGSAVRGKGREGEIGLACFSSCFLRRVDGAAAAHGKDHVRFLKGFMFFQRFGVFECRITAVVEGVEDLHLAFQRFAEERLSSGSGLVSADEDGGLAEVMADIVDAVIGVGTDGIAGEELICHRGGLLSSMIHENGCFYCNGITAAEP